MSNDHLHPLFQQLLKPLMACTKCREPFPDEAFRFNTWRCDACGREHFSHEELRRRVGS
jgi:PHP family Zn ribbon phosphoesterase